MGDRELRTSRLSSELPQVQTHSLTGHSAPSLCHKTLGNTREQKTWWKKLTAVLPNKLPKVNPSPLP